MLVEESAKRIAAIHCPIAVISVAGIYRTGKSYLLNRLLGRQSGFAVGPTVCIQLYQCSPGTGQPMHEGHLCLG